MVNLIMTEEWRKIDGHPGYEVSSYGRVRSLDRVVPRRIGGDMFLRGRLLKHKYVKTYPAVQLGRGRYELVSRLVCMVFHGAPPSDKHQAAHGDGNTANNHVDNLRWATPIENMSDQIRHGTRMYGSRNPAAKLTEEDVRMIRSLRRDGKLLEDIAAIFKVHHILVAEICRRERWKHI